MSGATVSIVGAGEVRVNRGLSQARRGNPLSTATQHPRRGYQRVTLFKSEYLERQIERYSENMKKFLFASLLVLLLAPAISQAQTTRHGRRHHHHHHHHAHHA